MKVTENKVGTNKLLHIQEIKVANMNHIARLDPNWKEWKTSPERLLTEANNFILHLYSSSGIHFYPKQVNTLVSGN